MKPMRILFAALLCAAMLACALPAFADVIWTPRDSFYESHADDCTYIGRSFIANGKDGFVGVYENPNSAAPAYAALNGTVVRVQFSYRAGQTDWGVVEFGLNDEGYVTNEFTGEPKTGWFPLHDMVVNYDSTAFMEEYADDIRNVSEGELSLTDVTGLVFWAYPGSGSIYAELTEPFENVLTFQQAYTDTAGREWGFVSYYYGMRNCWVCVSDPTATDLTKTIGNTEKFYPAAAPSPEDIAGGHSLWPILALVGAVVAATGTLIAVFGKRNRSNPKQ